MQATEEKYLCWREVCELTGVSRATLYVIMRKKGFPKPLKIGGSRRWLASEIHQWVREQNPDHDWDDSE